MGNMYVYRGVEGDVLETSYRDMTPGIIEEVTFGICIAVTI